MNWKLREWSEHFRINIFHETEKLPPMTKEEIQKATKYLRDNNYPKPEDCPTEKCPDYRPTCKLGTCKFAVCIC